MKALAAAVLVACAQLLSPPRATSAPAINLAWNDCIDGATATLNKNFACDTNAGSDVMVASFVAPTGMNQFISVEIYYEITQGTCGATAPWWQVKGVGKCRNGALTLNGDFTASSGACDASAWSVPAVGGVGAVTNDLPTPGHSMGNGVVAVPVANVVALTADVHYYGVKIVLSHAKTVGTGACVGCSIPWCFRLARLRLVQPTGSPGGNVDIVSVGTRAHVTYQAPDPSVCMGYCTPTHRSTWGSVKALYR